jgi:hypothetical protein
VCYFPSTDELPLYHPTAPPGRSVKAIMPILWLVKTARSWSDCQFQKLVYLHPSQLRDRFSVELLDCSRKIASQDTARHDEHIRETYTFVLGMIDEYEHSAAVDELDRAVDVAKRPKLRRAHSDAAYPLLFLWNPGAVTKI